MEPGFLRSPGRPSCLADAMATGLGSAPPDGRAPTCTSELAELALVPWVPPSRVVASQPHDEGSELRSDGLSAGPAVRVGSLPLDQVAVPRSNVWRVTRNADQRS